MVADGTLDLDARISTWLGDKPWFKRRPVTTSLDLVRWGIALFGGKAIDSQYLHEMLSSIAKPEHDEGDPGRIYGDGPGVNIAKTKHAVAYRHGGFFPCYNSLLAYYPDHGIALAMQINTDRFRIQEHFESITAIVVSAVPKAESRHRGLQ